MFQSKVLHLLGSRTDKHNSICRTSLREDRILTEESVTRMNSLCSCFPGSLQQGGYAEIAVRRRWRTDAHRFVCLLHMPRMAVGFGIHGNRAHAHLAKCSNNAACN